MPPSRIALRSAAAAWLLVACGGAGDATTTAGPATTAVPPTTTSSVPAVTASTTPLSTTTTTTTTTTQPPAQGLGYTFEQTTRSEGGVEISITYPRLIDLGAGEEAAINRQLDEWVRDLADDFAVAAPRDAAATSVLTVELAPELRNDSVFSLSGLAFSFDGATSIGVTRRIGWIFSIADGSALSAGDLFVGGDLEPLAEAARDHLIADVLGSEEAVVAPDGLLPEPANFHAVWLTPTGIGVGFDQYQVAAAEAGSPTVLIPYPELIDFIADTGVLAALEDGRLPEGV